MTINAPKDGGAAFPDAWGKAFEELDELRERVAELEAALRFYADERYDGYDIYINEYNLSMEVGRIIKDSGNIARSALKGGAK